MDPISLRRDFHRHAQTGWCEFYASARALELCRVAGFDARPFSPVSDLLGRPTAEALQRAKEQAKEWGAPADLVDELGDVTGVVAQRSFGPGPVAVLRFDIDAVDVTECRDKSHRPAAEGWDALQDGVAHACGHDGHTALGIVLAELIDRRTPRWHGRVRLLFQPAEEGVRGGKAMAEAGLVDDADWFIALHLGLWMKSGTAVCGTDGFLSTLKFDLTYKGVPAHAGGAPQEGQNALLAACHAAVGLHGLPRHGEGATGVNVGRLEAGEGRNVVAPNALLKGEVRGANQKVLDEMVRRARAVAEGAAVMQGVDCHFEVVGQSVGSFSDTGLSLLAKEAAQQAGFDTLVDKRQMTGSDDAAWLMNACRARGGQAVYLGLGADNCAGHHQSTFDFDERCLARGAEWLYNLLDKLLA